MNPYTRIRILLIRHHPQYPLAPCHVRPLPKQIRHRIQTIQTHHPSICRGRSQTLAVTTPRDTLHPTSSRILDLHQLLSSCQVVDPDLTLEPHRCQVLSIRTELDILHRLLVVREHSHQLSAGNAPQSYCQVIGGSGQVVAVRMKVDGLKGDLIRF